MTLKIIKNSSELDPEDRQFSELNKFCSEKNIHLEFEWIGGQFWLHSDNPNENPIGLEIDKILQKHEAFFKKSSIQKELLARAIGVKGSYRPRVLDLTAGLLGDSLLMLSFGCEVWAVERHPVIRFLIQSALQNSSHQLLENFHFVDSDAVSVLGQNLSIDSIYFDPMFDDVSDKVSPKKEMRIFRSLVGADDDAKSVFEAGLRKKPKRLVVKKTSFIKELETGPSVQYIGKSTRYDVYFSL